MLLTIRTAHGLGGDIACNDEQPGDARGRAAGEEARQIAGVAYLEVADEYGRILELTPQADRVRCQVARHEAGVPVHALDVLALEVTAPARADLQHAVLANNVEDLPEHRGHLGIVADRAGQPGQRLLAFDGPDEAVKLAERDRSCPFQPAAEEHRVATRGEVGAPGFVDRLEEDACRGGAIAGALHHLPHDVPHEHRADVFVRVGEREDAAGDDAPLVQDLRSTDGGALDDGVTRARAERGAHGGHHRCSPALQGAADRGLEQDA